MIEIYYADIQSLQKEELWQRAMAVLCDARIDKINKCKKEEDKLRGMAAGLLLEYGLRKRGLYQKKIHFTTEKNGKPKLVENPELFFNLTHSGDYAAAVFADSEVGIDLEKFRENAEKVAERFFSEEEREFLAEHRDVSSFTRIWTRKESYIKAVGFGVRMPFDSFSTVEEQVCQKPEAFLNGDLLKEAKCSYLQSYDIIPGYWLSVCTDGKNESAVIEKIDLTTIFC